MYFVNLQWFSFVHFVAALKACPVDFTVDSVELRGESAAIQVTVIKTSINTFHMILWNTFFTWAKRNSSTFFDLMHFNGGRCYSPNIRICPYWFLQYWRVGVADWTVLRPVLTPLHLVVRHRKALDIGPWILGAPGLDMSLGWGRHCPWTGHVEATVTGGDGSDCLTPTERLRRRAGDGRPAEEGMWDGGIQLVRLSVCSSRVPAWTHTDSSWLFSKSSPSIKWCQHKSDWSDAQGETNTHWLSLEWTMMPEWELLLFCFIPKYTGLIMAYFTLIWLRIRCQFVLKYLNVYICG